MRRRGPDRNPDCADGYAAINQHSDWRAAEPD